MFRRLALGFALSLAAAASFAASNTVVVLQPGDNVVNLALPAVAAPAVAAAVHVASTADTVAPIAAPRATCSAFRARNPVSELTRAYCKQADASRQR